MKTFKIQLVLNASDETMSVDVNGRLGDILVDGGFHPVSSLVEAQAAEGDEILLQTAGMDHPVRVDDLVAAYNRDQHMIELLRKDMIDQDSFCGIVRYDIYEDIVDGEAGTIDDLIDDLVKEVKP